MILSIAKLVNYDYSLKTNMQATGVKLFTVTTHVWHYDTQPNDNQPNDTKRNDIQPNDTQHNDTQRNDTQHNDTQHNGTQYCYAYCHLC